MSLAHIALVAAFATPVFACPEAARVEHATGTVVGFNASENPIELKYDRTSNVLVEYPEIDGRLLYMFDFKVTTDDRVWALHDEVQAHPNTSFAVELERTGKGDWTIVSWQRR